MACSSKSSSTNAASATGAAASVAATSTPAACPTKNTESFAKTKFVADVAIAGGAFKRYIYTPAKDGKFKKGANGRVLAFVKAAAAGALTVNRLEAAKTAAQANPTLCKLLAEPIAKFSAAVSGLIGKAKRRQHRPVGRGERQRLPLQPARCREPGRCRLHRQHQHQRLTAAIEGRGAPGQAGGCRAP